MNILRPLALLAVLLACAGPLRAADPERVLVKTKDFEIKESALDEAFVNLRASLAAQNRTLPEAQRPAIERQLLEKLTLTQILLRRATDDDRRIAKEKVDKILNGEKEKAKSQARYEAQIRALGMAPEVFEKQLLERGICEQVLDRDLRPRLGVTAEKVRAFFDQHPDRFEVPERLRLRQVVFSLKTPAGGDLGDAEKLEKQNLAGQIRERAGKGEEFEQLARQYSDDPQGRDRGGEYIFPVGRMLPEFETVVQKLATNQVSEVFSTPGAIHIVKLVERMPSEKVPFEKVATQIKDGLEMEATQAILPQVQKELFAAAGVKFTATEADKPK